MRGWVFALIVVLFLSGCLGGSQDKRQFVCWDGSVVSEPNTCPSQTSSSTFPASTTLTEATSSTSLATTSSTVAASSSTTIPPIKDFVFTQNPGRCENGLIDFWVSAEKNSLSFWGTLMTSTPSYTLSAERSISKNVLRVDIKSHPKGGQLLFACLGEVSFKGVLKNISMGVRRLDMFYNARNILPVNYVVYSDGVKLLFLCGGADDAICPVGSVCALPDIPVLDYEGVCVNFESDVVETSSSTTLSSASYSTTLSSTSRPATSTTLMIFHTPSEPASSGLPIIEITAVQFDAPGPGKESDNLNGEWIKISNTGDAAQDFTGWTLSDAANHKYSFPEGYTLGAQDSVTVHTGSGTDSTSDLYWGSRLAIWNNGGDTATLADEDGETVSSHTE